MAFDVVALSSVYLDIYCTNFPFDVGFKVETQTVGQDYAMSPGGSGVIFAQSSKALDLKPLLLGKMGNDAVAQLIETQLQAQDVATNFIKDATKHSNISVNYINPQGKNILTTVGTANQSLSPDEIKPIIEKQLPQAKVLYLGSLFKYPQVIPCFIELLRDSKDTQTMVVLDHGRVTNAVGTESMQLVKELVRYVTYYIPSREEFLQVWQAHTIESGIQIVQEYAPQTSVIVTKDQQGAWGCNSQGEVHHTQARDIHQLNTVGSGDTFNAGFVYAALQGMSFAQAMDFAQVTAEIKIETNQFPTVDQVKHVLESL